MEHTSTVTVTKCVLPLLMLGYAPAIHVSLVKYQQKELALFLRVVVDEIGAVRDARSILQPALGLPVVYSAVVPSLLQRSAVRILLKLLVLLVAHCASFRGCGCVLREQQTNTLLLYFLFCFLPCTKASFDSQID